MSASSTFVGAHFRFKSRSKAVAAGQSQPKGIDEMPLHVATAVVRNDPPTELEAPPPGVGQTAIFVAWLRHHESQRPDALFHDPFARSMLEALADDPVLADVSDVAREAEVSARGFREYFAVRTRFFDDALLAALRSGIRQVVCLAAGMDGRTFRLACPPSTRWFEVDMPEMSELKDALIARSQLTPTCERFSVGADLTSDWPRALRLSGFDPGQATAWLIEGLLMYLTEPAGDALVADLTALSAPGSRLMLEHLKAMMLGEEGKPARDRVESQGTTWLSGRDDLQPWLSSCGWNAEVYAGTDPSISYGRTVARLPAAWLVSAELAALAA